MPGFKIVILGILSFLISVALGSKCPEDAISKLVVCYFEGESPITNLNICNCTHAVFTNAVRKAENNSIGATEGTLNYLNIIKESKKNISAIFTLEKKSDEISAVLKSKNKSEELISNIADFLKETQFDGVELNFQFSSQDGVTKELFASFLKSLSKTLSFIHRRVKREGYDVFEKLQDDITTVGYTTQTPKNSTSKTQSIKQRSGKGKESKRKVREEKDEDDADYLTLEEAINTEFSEEKQNSLKDAEDDVVEEKKLWVFVRLSTKPEIIAKLYDLKSLSRYADVLIIPTHNIVNKEEGGTLTYHPSRLMGLSDMLNTDSILDFLTGMGGLKSKMVISLPAAVLKFQLKDEKKNTPRSPAVSKPEVIDQSQLCALFSKNNWTLERDDDLTAPYAFSGKTWLAFEDEISVNIKGKYILLRDLAGGAIYPIDYDLNDGSCTNRTGSGGYLTGILRRNFESLERKPRALVLESLQDEIHDVNFISAKAGVQVSEYRIVRVVDHSGAVHVIRKNTKTQFECSRQGYFSHPLGCNKFYRCVKFDQYSNDFTVFEYDCPAGLAFDERWEVCVWPGSLPHGAPCTGSSEIAPVPRSHYQCPNHEGYFADPENCRWFFACLDHARDGITPLTAYEFRCPFGLVFSEEKLACDWPWLVGACGNKGAAGYLNINAAGLSQGIHSTTFINGGNLEASFGQLHNLDQTYFANFGQKFGSSLRESGSFNGQSTYQGAQSAGYGYIASQFENNHDKASFAAFPDYEISGGRIINKGGVVLDQNIAGISSGSIGGNLGTLSYKGTSGESRSLGDGAKYIQQNIVHTTPQIILQPAPTTAKTTILETSGLSSGGQTSLLTPKPFSVHIPSVQINEEFSGHSTVGSTTPKTFVFSENPQTNNVNIQFTDVKHAVGNQYSTPRGFTASQPDVSVTPTLQVHTLGGVVTEGYDATHLRSDLSLGVTPKTQIHRFGQANSKLNEFSSNINQHLGTVVGQSFGYGSSGSTAKEVSLSVPVVTPKPEIHSFESTASGHAVGINQSPVTVGVPVAYNAGGFKAKEVSVSVPAITPKPDIHTIEYTASGSTVDAVQPFVSTQTPFVGFSQSQNLGKGFEKSFVPISVSSSVPAVQTFGNTEKQHVVTGNVAVGHTGVPLVAVTPSVSTGSRAPATSSSTDAKVSIELKLNNAQNIFSIPESDSGRYPGQFGPVSNKIPLTTPTPLYSPAGFNINGELGKNGIAVSTVTPQPDLNLSGYYQEHTGQTAAPAVTSSIHNSFHQTGTAHVLKEISKTSGSLPVSVPEAHKNNFVGLFDEKGTSEESQKSYGIPLVTSEIRNEFQTQQISNGIKYSQADVPLQPAFGQRYSYSSSFKQSGSQLDSIRPFGGLVSTPKPALIEKTQIFTPKFEQPKPFTAVTVEQQPIVSVGTVGPTIFEEAVSTPKPYTQIFSQSSGINLKSTFGQPVAAPAPVASVTPSAVYQVSGANIVGSSQRINLKEQEKINAGSYSLPVEQIVAGVPGGINFDEKLKQVQSFGHVTTSIPPTFNEELISGKSAVYDKTSSYLPPVHQISAEEFRSAGGNQISVLEEPSKPLVNNYVELLKTKPLIEEKRTEFVLNPQVQVTTAAPAYQQPFRPAAATGKPFAPREQLVGLEITKSVEVNPSEFFESAKQQLPIKSIETQQQALSFVSQKEFPIKQQTFYQQPQKVVVDTQSQNFGTSYQQQFEFQQQTNVGEPVTKIFEQKQYLLPAVTAKPQINTYSTVKTVKDEGATSVFDSSKISLVGGTQTKKYLPPSAAKIVIEKQEPVVSKINILRPTSTDIPQYTPSVSEEFTVHIHRNFDSKKINTPAPLQSVFIQPEVHSTLKPALSVFQSSNNLFNYNVTAARTRFGSGFKYAVNPNIEIPEPPREYILAQNAFTTLAPELSAANQFQFTSSESYRNQQNLGSTSSPSLIYNKPTEASLGFDGEDVRHDDAQQIFEKYSGRFGQAIGGVNAQKTGEGSSTVRYKISSTTPKQRTKGRLYHGDLTSGRQQASNKYEEYEINGQRSGKEEDSKTTIDLKNLKLDKDKKTVIVVSQVSDANPVLIGKLAGQCSCQSNMLELRSKGKKSKGNSRRKNKNSSPQHSLITNEYLPPYEGSQSKIEEETLRSGGSKEPTSYAEQNLVSFSTTAQPELVSSTILSSLGPDGVLSITPKTLLTEERGRSRSKQFRGRTRYLPPPSLLSEDGSPVPLLSSVPASEIASTFDYSVLSGDESRTQNEIDGGQKSAAGAAFDRYGPGGWRGFDETLQGSIDCKRPGLFRHPKHCNKFYACNYDPWKERFTLHVFNCPIHLTYDSSISACNWPVRGPACADDNLLV